MSDFTLDKHNYFSGVRDGNNWVSAWSIFKVNSVLDQHTLLHSHRDQLELEYQGFVTTVDGDKWLDVWRAAEKLVHASGDMHHVFIEGFVPTEHGSARFQMITGS